MREADEKRRPEFLAVSRELTSALGLLGKATGEIQTGVKINVLNAVYQRLGVKDEAELMSLIESGRKLIRLQENEDTSFEEYRDDAVEVLKMLFGEHPEWHRGYRQAEQPSP